MAAYRHNWSLELTTFATKIYHGHRGVPPTMDVLMDKLVIHNRKAAAGKLGRLIEVDRVRSETETEVDRVDVSKVDPIKMVGLWLEKDFDGFGKYRGQVKSHDKDALGRDLFSVQYLDGDQEDLFLHEILGCVSVEDVILHINK